MVNSQGNPSPNNQLPLTEHKPLSDLEVDERAAEAQSLLDNPVFAEALNDIYSQALGTLLNSDVGSLTASTAHATMKAIRDVRVQLELYITDKKMRSKYGKGNK